MKNSENFYKMLDIETTATVPEIKKAYKKLALLLHPDKNTAPGSGEVFVGKYFKINFNFIIHLIIFCVLVVSNAVETLCDTTKRKTYDTTLKKTSSRYNSESEFHK